MGDTLNAAFNLQTYHAKLGSFEYRKRQDILDNLQETVSNLVSEREGLKSDIQKFQEETESKLRVSTARASFEAVKNIPLKELWLEMWKMDEADLQEYVGITEKAVRDSFLRVNSYKASLTDAAKESEVSDVGISKEEAEMFLSPLLFIYFYF